MLPASSARPGPWDPALAPYLDTIAEAIADPLVDQVSVVMGTQMSKTEGCMLNPMGWTLEDRPRPMVYIGPTQNSVKKISQEEGRFDRMLQEVPELRERIDPRANLQTTFARQIGGVPVIFAWAGSESEVASNPAAQVYVDEFDKMDAAVLENARSRTKTYADRLVVVCSTPTVIGESNIMAQFDEGTRERWHWRCPHCAQWFYPRAATLKWGQGLVGHDLRESAYIECPECEQAISEEQRRTIEGRFFATEAPAGDHAPEADPGADADVDRRLDIAPRISHRSFQVSGLATWSMTIGELAEIWARACRSRDQDRIREALNDFLGEPYRAVGDSPGWLAVWNLREGYTRPPSDARWCTIGADPAKDRIDYVVRAWGPGAESWLIQEGVLYGDTLLDRVFLDLQALCAREWHGLPVILALCDMGYRKATVYAACRRQDNLAASRGYERADLRYRKTLADVDEHGQRIKVGTALWHLDASHWKGWVYGRIRWPAGEAGAWHVHGDITEDYARQVTNEELLELPNGKHRWVKTGNKQNHKLDCEALAAAAAYISGVEGLSNEVAPPPPPRRRGPSQFRRHGL